jgi:hypothetical protein
MHVILYLCKAVDKINLYLYLVGVQFYEMQICFSIE